MAGGDPDTFRVSPALTNLPMVVAPPVENASPQQLVQAGQAITRAGGVAGTIYEDVLKELNATRVTEQLTELTKARNEKAVLALSETGKNALFRPDGKSLDEEFGEDFDNTISTLEEGLGNDAQRKMFREAAQRMSVEFRGRIQAHVVEQDRTYRLEVDAGVVDTGSRQVALATTPEEITEGMALIERGANGIFSTKGTPDVARAEVLRELKTPGLAAQITNRLVGDDLEGASALLNQYRGDLTAEMFTKLNDAIVEQRSIIEGGEEGERIFGMRTAQAGAATPQPVAMPVFGAAVRSPFGPRNGRQHRGIDISVGAGTDVRAGADGTIRVRNDPDGFGTYVDLVLDDGTVLRNGHLSSVVAKDGTRVRAGDVIAKSGGAKGSPGAGNSTGPHLHYEVLVNGKQVDPIAWHEGKPTVASTQGGGGRSKKEMLEELYSKNLSPKAEAAAERKIDALFAAERIDKAERQDDAVNNAYTTVARNGGVVTPALIGALSAAGQASALPGLLSFGKAMQDRASGKKVDETSSLQEYGLVKMAIADGGVTSMAQLMRHEPYLTESQFKQLADDLASAPRDGNSRLQQTLKEIKTEVDGSGIFVKDEKFDKKRYSAFVGSSMSAIEEQEKVKGRPLFREERREIVLGLLGVGIVNGDRTHNFEVRQIYDSIPKRAKINAIRALRNNGEKNPTTADVVNVWNRLTRGQRRAYEENP